MSSNLTSNFPKQKLTSKYLPPVYSYGTLQYDEKTESFYDSIKYQL